MITTREMKLLEDLIDEEGVRALVKAIAELCKKKGEASYCAKNHMSYCKWENNKAALRNSLRALED